MRRRSAGSHLRLRRLTRRIAARAVHAWRSSLQVRIGAITMVVAGTVVVIVSLVLFSQIRDQLLSVKRQAAIEQAQAGVFYAQTQVAGIATGDASSVRSTLDRTVKQLLNRSGSAGAFDVVMLYRTGDIVRPPPAAGGVPALPADLRADVGSGGQSYRYAMVPDSSGTPQPTLLIGAPVPGGRLGSEKIALYYAFPLAQEEREPLADPRHRDHQLIALTLFVVGIGVLVTRLVVDPVRRAAGTAQRLAEGQLEERMAVRGEDDLARLATQFQRDGRQPAAADQAAGGAVAAAAAVTSDVSHERRTPLTTVQMAAEVLHEARAGFDPHVARSAELLRAELDRFEGLLTDLLEISRYDAGAAVLDPQPTDLGALVARVAAGMYALPSSTVPAGGQPPRRRRDRRGRRPAGGADPAQSRGQRDRARRGPAGRDHARGQSQRRGRDRARPRGGPGLGRGAARLRPVLARRSLPGAHGRRQRPRPVDQPGGRPAARRLAAGLGSARRRGAVPADHPADRRGGPHELAPAAAPGGAGPARGPAMSGRPALRLLAVGCLLALLSACSTVPTSSPTVRITQAALRPTEHVGIEPLPPEHGATPEEIVRSFIDAAASSVPGHPVAREHLAAGPAGTWSDEAGITVISPDYAIVTTDAGTVEVTASIIGTVDARGVFSVAGPGTFTRSYTLKQVKGEWRITDPPDGLVILEPDFQRLYDLRAAYFIDPTGQRVVPDPRYLITGEAQPTVLVERLLSGPSAALAGGVRNPLAGVQLRRTVSVSGQTATVDLTGVSTDPAPVLSEISAQLVWTLQQTSISTVLILVDGQPIHIPGVPVEQTVDDWTSFDPDAMPADAVGHYLDHGALRTVTKGAPAPGPAGKGTYALTSAAAAGDVRTGALTYLAGVRILNGQATLLSGKYGGPLAPAVTATTLTAPTVAGTRSEVWVVKDGSTSCACPSAASSRRCRRPRCPVWGVRWCCGSRPTACGPPSSSTDRKGRRSTSARSCARRTARSRCATCVRSRRRCPGSWTSRGPTACGCSSSPVTPGRTGSSPTRWASTASG